MSQVLNLDKLKKAIKDLKSMKIVGEGPTMAWDFENQCLVGLPPKNG